jgi:hypothetical protein
MYARGNQVPVSGRSDALLLAAREHGAARRTAIAARCSAAPEREPAATASAE